MEGSLGREKLPLAFRLRDCRERTKSPACTFFATSTTYRISGLAVQAGDSICRGCREKRARRRFGSLPAIAQPERQWQFLATQTSFHAPRSDRSAPAVRASRDSVLSAGRSIV